MTDIINRPSSPNSGQETNSPPLKKKPRLRSPSPLPLEELDTHDKTVRTLTATQGGPNKKSRNAKKKQKHAYIEPYSTEDVVLHDVKALLGQDAFDQVMAEGSDWNSPFEHREEVQLVVSCLSSTGEFVMLLEIVQPSFFTLSMFLRILLFR